MFKLTTTALNARGVKFVKLNFCILFTFCRDILLDQLELYLFHYYFSLVLVAGNNNMPLETLYYKNWLNNKYFKTSKITKISHWTKYEIRIKSSTPFAICCLR